jgi:hypothetical protein
MDLAGAVAKAVTSQVSGVPGVAAGSPVGTAVSPVHRAEPGQWPPAATDERLEVLRARIEGWQLAIAEHCLERPHGAYGALSIVISYFELAAQLARGESSRSRSPEFFKEGLEAVFPGLRGAAETDDLAARLYDDMRCGLYHQAMARPGVSIRDYPFTILLVTSTGAALTVDEAGDVRSGAPLEPETSHLSGPWQKLANPVVFLNPAHLVPAIRRHCNTYFEHMADPTNKAERARFDRAFLLFHQ